MHLIPHHVYVNTELSKEHFAYGLIEKMIQKVEERIGLTVVIQKFEEKCRQRTICEMFFHFLYYIVALFYLFTETSST